MISSQVCDLYSNLPYVLLLSLLFLSFPCRPIRDLSGLATVEVVTLESLVMERKASNICQNGKTSMADEKSTPISNSCADGGYEFEEGTTRPVSQPHAPSALLSRRLDVRLLPVTKLVARARVQYPLMISK